MESSSLAICAFPLKELAGETPVCCADNTSHVGTQKGLKKDSYKGHEGSAKMVISRRGR